MDRNKLSIVFLTSCFWSIVITYFKAHQPLKRIIFCHTYIMIAVTLQFFLAPLVAFEPNGDVSTTWYHFIGTWLHIINGLGLLGVTLFFGYEVLRRKGIPWLFPYLFNNFEAIKADLKQIRSIRFSITDIKNAEKGTRPFIILEQMALPRPHPGGLGPAAQGIGMALQSLLVILGFFFLITWSENLDIAWMLGTMHKIIAIPFFLFYLAHGLMGLLHIFNHHAQQRLKKVRADASGNVTGTESCELPK
ncbi:MAG: hypothetical protein MI749_01130 [Desulfovibrionales bacterium]|nr:hypothetical protein [Desulfovibrionales bacterium]